MLKDCRKFEIFRLEMKKVGFLCLNSKFEIEHLED